MSTSDVSFSPPGRRLAKNINRADLAFAALLAAYCLYAALYIYRTSYVVDGERYFSLFDDAMVSMGYARSLAQGHGLVWYPGAPRVEGFTNPLWTLLMALFHLLPIPAARISLLVQVSGALFLVANLFFVRRIADLLAPGSAFAGLAAVALTAFYLPLNTWGLQGTEVSLLTLVVTAAAWLGLRVARSRRFSTWLYVLLGGATLVRPDMAVPCLAFVAYLALIDRRARRRHLLVGLGLAALFVAVQTAFRLWYYGDPLPNTYYLKMSGFPPALRMARGLRVALEFAWPIGWLIAVAGLGAAAYRRERLLPLLIWVFLAQVAYSVYVGGDAWEWWGGANRYIAIAMPVLFAAFACVVARAGTALSERLEVSGVTYAQWGLVALAFLSMSGFAPGPAGRQTPADWLLLDPPLHVAGNRDTAAIAHLVKGVTTEQARVAVTWAGAIPYFAARPAVDILGKSDPVIARLPMRLSQNPSRSAEFYPGHLKWDYGYSIGELRPDVVAQLWQPAWEAQPYLDAHYLKVNLRGYDLYLLKGSPHILWERIEDVANPGV
ncbi:MAG: glycosyltransferase family 39 protein [Anaerolineae bacterium]|nr:glycosyltransferase family 39 protein [Anaerolineae bacterium]